MVSGVNGNLIQVGEVGAGKIEIIVDLFGYLS